MTPVLAAEDRACLDGAYGEAARFCMTLLLQFAQAVEARSFIAAEAAHIDGCLYLGKASIDFVEHLIRLGGRVRVPTTLNVGSVDLIHPDVFRGEARLGDAGARLMRAHEVLGCLPTFTCAPYQTLFRPRFGAQIAWGESNAIVFANSVIGARTNRYGDFIDLCCAITGRLPFYGLHRSENRRARLRIDVTGWPLEWEGDTERIAICVGHIVGRRSGERVPVIVGLPFGTSEDDLKALGAVAASSGALALFHAVGLTPEAPTVEEALGGEDPEEVVVIGPEDLRRTFAGLSTIPHGTPLAAVCLGTPHFSLAEFARLMPLLDGARLQTDLYVNTSRHLLPELAARGWDQRLADAGATLVVDTCAYVTSVLRELEGAVMTNSGKMAYYAPGNLGVEIAFGSLEDCLMSARVGRVTRR